MSSKTPLRERGGVSSPASKLPKDSAWKLSLRSPQRSPSTASPSKILERSHQLRLRVQGLLNKGAPPKQRAFIIEEEKAEAKPSTDSSSSDDDVAFLFPRASSAGRSQSHSAFAPAQGEIKSHTHLQQSQSGSSADNAADFIEVSVFVIINFRFTTNFVLAGCAIA